MRGKTFLMVTQRMQMEMMVTFLDKGLKNPPGLARQ